MYSDSLKWLQICTCVELQDAITQRLISSFREQDRICFSRTGTMIYGHCVILARREVLPSNSCSARYLKRLNFLFPHKSKCSFERNHFDFIIGNEGNKSLNPVFDEKPQSLKIHGLKQCWNFITRTNWYTYATFPLNHAVSPSAILSLKAIC